ncbi:Acp5, partial [Symbiodinium natans]
MLRLGRFALLPLVAGAGCVDLLVMGDYGTRDARQASVARGLAAVASVRQPAAVAAIGDNLYPSGADYNPWTIVRWWRDVYMGYDSLNRPWHVITGNHDWMTDGTVERDFTSSSENPGGHWQMPDFWFKKTYAADGLTVDAFYIDTQVWKGSYLADQTIGRQARQRQIDWLFSQLEKSTADWKIVLGHHPIYSAGNHGMTEVLY